MKTAQRLGITLDEIREILALRERGSVRVGTSETFCAGRVAAVDNPLVELRQLREHLTELEPGRATDIEPGTESRSANRRRP